MAKGIEIKIFSDDDLIIIEKGELGEEELVYLRTAKNLIEWAKRNEIHAKGPTRKGADFWLKKLNQKLDIADTAANSEL